MRNKLLHTIGVGVLLLGCAFVCAVLIQQHEISSLDHELTRDETAMNANWKWQAEWNIKHSVIKTAALVNGQLVYICQQAPCTDNQEFAIADGNDAPIFSVGEYGGAAVFGDNFSVFPPNTVYNPAIKLSWTTPDGYADTFNLPDACVAPAKWIDPSDTFTCQYGVWKRIGA